MGAMTMAFKAPKGGVPRNVREGTSVQLRVRADAAGRHAADVDRARGAGRGEEVIAGADPLVDRQSLPRAARGGARRRRRRVGGAHDAARCDSRSVRHAGDHPHDVSRPGAADRRGPGHLSADDDDAVGARARRSVRGYSFFGDSFVYILFEDGTDLVLGALARARVPEPGAGAAAAPARSRRSGPTPPASAGSTSTRWSTAAAGTTSRSCARCRTGSSSTS